MNNHDRGLSRRDAERLLDDPTVSRHALGPVLDAARAPVRAGELAREEVTVAAFHSSRLCPPPTRRSNFVSPSALGRRAAARAVLATGAVVAVTSSGIALAATGHLPTLPDQASDRATESVAKHTTRTSSPSETATTEALDPTDEPTSTHAPGATPSPSLEGLCKAYQASDKTARGRALDSAAFAALTTAAGGKDAVATYCVTLVGEAKAKPARPTQAATPTKPVKPVKPTQAATPTKPVKPTQAATPTKPVKPTQAATPTTPPKPTKTAVPTPEVGPTRAVSPTRPVEPEQSGKPDGDSTR